MNQTNDFPILSIRELNALTRNILESSLELIWVRGEISNFIQSSAGHCYFTLKDANAQVRCALFRMSRNRVDNDILKNGKEIIVYAKVTLYEARGDYQLIVQQVQLAGVGLLQQQFEALKKKLSALGLFAEAHKKPLPFLPQTIGVITSPTGAAIHDILRVLKQRFPAVSVMIYPSLVQGDKAAAQLIAALECANRRKECDVLILARGGGSLEDLWPFNDEALAHAIFKSEIPVVSGVGHEIDFTISDFVADARAPTPSAAAMAVVPSNSEFLQLLFQAEKQLEKIALHKLKNLQFQLQALLHRIPHPLRQIQNQLQAVDQYEWRLKQSIKQFLETQKQKLHHCAYALETLSPLKTLTRGYAILRDANTGVIVRSKNTVKTGEKLLAKVSDGEFLCSVE